MDEAYRVTLQALSPPLSSMPLCGGSGCITSPPDSEAYYGETDSDADVVAQERQRRQRRRSPSSSPAKPPPEEEETSEMSGYESAPDTSGYLGQMQHRWAELQGPPQQQHVLPGVARREVVYQPLLTEFSSGQSSPQDSQGVGEGDSGFQEPPAMMPPPLVSPERAREALMLASRRQLVPMVGPVDMPLDEELLATYKDKARQAKLNRGESGQDKQVKEARSKCRTIASLLTDAPNPHAKGVLMFKKRRQRAKKYTLTCFGNADDASLSRSETEDEEEGSSFQGSESELDEDGFTASTEPDPIWDSGYLDLLDKRSSACIGGGRLDIAPENGPGLSNMSGKGAQLFEQQRQRAVKSASAPLSHMSDEQLAEMAADVAPVPLPYAAPSAPVTPGLVNGDPMVVSRTSVVLTPPGHTNLPTMPSVGPDTVDSQAGGSIHNRTAKPFAPGNVTHRASTAPVVFRPSPARKAVSVANVPAAFTSSSSPDVKRAVSSTSLYIPARPATVSGPPSAGASQLSPHTSVSVASFPPPAPHPHAPPHSAPFSPPAPPHPHPPSHTAPLQPPTPPAYSQLPMQPPPVNPPPPYMSQTFCQPSSMAAAPYSPPAPPTTPFSPQQAPTYCPPQSVPFCPPPVPSKPYPSPHAQAGPYPPPPQQSIPVSPQNQPHTPFPPPSVMTMPYSQPPTSDAMAFPQAPVSTPYALSQPIPPSPSSQQPPTAPKVSFNPYVSVAASPQPPAGSSPQPYQPVGTGQEALASREQRIAVPAARTGILQDARKRSNRKPMFSAPEEKKGVTVNPALLSMVQNLDERPRGTNDLGFESGPEEDSLNLGAEACNFMQTRGSRLPPPPVAPKPARAAIPPAPQPCLQTGGKGAELFARRQNRMDRYVVDKQQTHHMSPAQPRDPSPTPSLPSHWKYSPNIRAPPPINYNPLLSPSCPPVAQRIPKASEPPRVAQKPGLKPVDFMSHQPYQLNSSLFSYGGGVPQTQQQQQQGVSLTAPRQVPVKAARVYEIKRFSTPTPMSAPTSLTPTVIVPRSATTLAEPIWRSDVASPPPQAPLAPTPYTPASQPMAPAVSSVTMPALPHLSAAPIQGSAPYTPAAAQLYGSQFQAAKQFKSAPELSPLAFNPALRPSSTQPLRVPRPRFSTSNVGLQPNVWRPGSMIH
ncbi:hypothetical protein ACEWY4_001386 [Coilia grayii]|uniref:Synaptopodin 2-like protein n=1 Tax=Coilia grayii TaxID=363190 RepID=A0ABD1KSV9_9TELE